MKLFGHPLHVMFIHFPSALLPMDLVCGVLAFFAGWPHLLHAGFYAAAGGVIVGWLALITGAADLLTVAKKHPGALNKTLLHGGINGLVVTGFTVTALLELRHFPDFSAPSVAMLVTKAVLVLFLFAGNYFGGSLILKHGVGLAPGK